MQTYVTLLNNLQTLTTSANTQPIMQSQKVLNLARVEGAPRLTKSLSMPFVIGSLSENMSNVGFIQVDRNSRANAMSLATVMDGCTGTSSGLWYGRAIISCKESSPKKKEMVNGFKRAAGACQRELNSFKERRCTTVLGQAERNSGSLVKNFPKQKKRN